VCIRYRGNVSTEPLPSNNRGIFTEPLPSNDMGIFSEPLPNNDKALQRDLISLLDFFKLMNVGIKAENGDGRLSE
jgi:hypothetical protein